MSSIDLRSPYIKAVVFFLAGLGILVAVGLPGVEEYGPNAAWESAGGATFIALVPAAVLALVGRRADSGISWLKAGFIYFGVLGLALFMSTRRG